MSRFCTKCKYDNYVGKIHIKIIKGLTHPNYECMQCGISHMPYSLHVNWWTRQKFKLVKLFVCNIQGHMLSKHDQYLLLMEKPDMLETYCSECGNACKAYIMGNKYKISSMHDFVHHI
jgi:hypothetical protein